MVKVGSQLLATSFDGTDRSGPIDLRRADGRLLRQISFSGSGEIEASDVITSAYLQELDHQLGESWLVGVNDRPVHEVAPSSTG